MVLATMALSCLSCQLFRFGPSDEELIDEVLTQFAQGITERDIDLIEPILSEDFVGAQGESKSAVVTSLPQALETARPTIDVSEVEIKVEGDKAIAAPIRLEAMGNVTEFRFHFVRIGLEWFISQTEVV
jgi:hypothetical protein